MCNAIIFPTTVDTKHTYPHSLPNNNHPVQKNNAVKNNKALV